ncbi:MAG: ribonuclease HII [Cyanobacteria bacterium]|nr:ribonuclease HII [Cyanobacteriota bacterium]
MATTLKPPTQKKIKKPSKPPASQKKQTGSKNSPSLKLLHTLQSLLDFDKNLYLDLLQDREKANLGLAALKEKEEKSRLSPTLLLVGTDEVGRGCLMGPVVAGAVYLPPGLSSAQKKRLLRLNDSKKLSPLHRSELAEEIKANYPHGIGEASPQEIDELNIHQASLLAMARAYHHLIESLLTNESFYRSTGSPLLCLALDGRTRIPEHYLDALGSQKPLIQVPIIKGDGQSASIAAASVLAKHHRDTLVIALANTHPGYFWEKNMGYPTPEHKEGIQKLGPTLHHRHSFKGVSL